MTTRAGCPIAVSVYEGNTADAQTLLPQIEKLRVFSSGLSGWCSLGIGA